MNGYELSRKWFDFSFENPNKIKPIHTAIYFFAIEHCNRLGWKKTFGFPTSMVIEAIGVKSYSSYKKHFDELADFGFIKIIEYSKNQYSSNIIELTLNDKASDKALDKALQKHSVKQVESTVSINKQLNKEQRTLLYSEQQFLKDWNELRKSILNKPSNRNRIGNFDSIENFKELLKHYTQEDFKNSITGLFKQEVMPHGNEVMRTDPKHLLQNFERYLTAYDEKNAKIYGEKKKVDRL